MDYKLNEEEQRYIRNYCNLKPAVLIAKTLNKEYKAVWNFCKRKNLKIIPYKKGKNINNIYLSWREIEVLELIAKGLTNIEISNKLFISYYTVRFHILKIFAKLGIYKKDNENSFMRVQATLWYLKYIKGIDC